MAEAKRKQYQEPSNEMTHRVDPSLLGAFRLYRRAHTEQKGEKSESLELYETGDQHVYRVIDSTRMSVERQDVFGQRNPKSGEQVHEQYAE